MGQDVNLARKIAIKMLVVFSPIFVADTKIIIRHDFVAPLNLAPKTCRRYPDDTHVQFKSKTQSRKFQKILNKQYKQIYSRQ